MHHYSIKLLRYVILFLLGCYVQFSLLAGSELLRNPGFEDGKKHWNFSSGSAGVIDNVSPHGGKSALKMVGDGEWKMVQQTVKVEPGRQVTFSFWIKLTDCDHDVTVVLQHLNEKWSAIESMELVKLSGSAPYKQYSFTVKTPPGTDKIRIRLNGNGSESGAVYFDDLSIHYSEAGQKGKSGDSVSRECPLAVSVPAPALPAAAKSGRRGTIRLQSRKCRGIYICKSDPTNQPYDEAAARVIQQYLRQASGIELPIKYLDLSTDKITSGMILVGKLARDSGVVSNDEIKKLSPGGYIIKAKDGIAAIAGPGYDGVISGAYQFIERALKVDFVASGSNFTVTEPPIQSGSAVEIGRMDIAASPAMAFRFARNVVPLGYSDFMLLGDATLIGCKYDNTCHTANGFINYEKYKDSHPEYFAMLSDGKRMRKTANMRRFDVHYCVSNPAVVKIVTRSLINWMKADPKAKYFWVTPGDGRNRYCHCKKCQAMDIKPGVVSDRWLKFINKIAKAAAKECPGKKILTLAYVDLEQPPIKTRPADNVIVMYCPYPMNWGNHLAAFDDKEYNSAGIKTLKGWVKIAGKNLGIFCYPSSCTEQLAIWPSFYANYEKLKYYLDNHLAGIEFCGLFPFHYGKGMPGHNSFNELQLYVLSEVMWHPDLKVEKAINHFMKLYYGPGAPAMREFWDLIHEQVKVNGRHFAQHTEETKRGFVTDKFAKAAYAIFAKAEKATKGTRFYERIEKEKMHLLYADLTDRCLGNAKISPSNMAEYAKKIGEFLRITKKLAITTFRRRKTTDWFWDTMLLKVKSPRLYDDPVVIALLNNPLQTLRKSMKLGQKAIAGGWEIDGSSISGGNSYKMFNRAGKKVAVRVARRPSSGLGTLMAIFKLTKVPDNAVLLISGRGHRGNESGEVLLNGKVVYTGRKMFKQHWSEIKIRVPGKLLHPGLNQVIIRNTTADVIGKDSDKGVDYIRAKKRNYYWGWFAVENVRLVQSGVKLPASDSYGEKSQKTPDSFACSSVKSPASDSYVDKPEGYDFTSKGISCRVNPSGHISNLSFGGKQIFNSIQLFALVKLDGQKKASRLYQANSKAKLLRVKATPGKASVICEGVLVTGNKERVATFRQKTLIGENTIHFDNEVITTKQITVKPWFSFTTFILAAVKNLLDAKVREVNIAEKVNSFPFPRRYSKEKAFHQNQLTSCQFSWDVVSCNLVLDDEKNTRMDINDGRAWHEDNVDIQIKPQLKSNGDNLVCQIGTKITWSFAINFENRK